jgi:hypothetical protein
MLEEWKFAVEVLGFVVTVGVLLWRLSAATTTFTLIGNRQADEIKEMKLSMDKMEAAIALIAVQDVKLTAMMERQDSTDRRNDARFARLETMIDDLRHGRGIVQ